MGALRVLDKTGDTRHDWDTSNPETVEAARTAFNQLVEQGYLPCKVEGEGEVKTFKKLDRFDPDAVEIVLVPKIAGG